MQNQRYRVLMVEDDLSLRRMLSRLLKLGGHTVKEAGDFQEALEATEQDCNFQVILLDVNFPGGGGQKLLPILRDRCPEAMVVVVSAVEDAQVTFDLLAGGAADFIPKPFDVDMLLERVDALYASRAS